MEWVARIISEQKYPDVSRRIVQRSCACDKAASTGRNVAKPADDGGEVAASRVAEPTADGGSDSTGSVVDPAADGAEIGERRGWCRDRGLRLRGNALRGL